MSVGWQSPWALAAFGVLVGTLVLDLLLRTRYAGGTAEHDEGTARQLIVSLNLNFVVLLTLPALGVASLPPAAAASLAPFGFALCLAGVGIRYAAIFSLGRLFTWQVSILDGHSLHTAGLFSVVRHPSYAGGLLGMAGAALAFGSWGALLCFALTHVPLVVRRIRVEERALERAFGAAYRAYAARTARLLPGVF
ncbi:MAG: isoprenylcysteine carboxylmethyltransferase family protein [Myxococcales bacterium]|nr:isoprenylcysteine carboxylmethyltransferase family protein [Myxococcales bacterium]